MPRHRYKTGGPTIPAVITRENDQQVRDLFLQEPAYQIGAPSNIRPPAWVHQEVILEVPLGELARGGLQTMALIGRSSFRNVPLTGKENFDAQGLEGKVQIKKDLFSAVMNLDILPHHRGRVLTGAMAAKAKTESTEGWRSR